MPVTSPSAKAALPSLNAAASKKKITYLGIDKKSSDGGHTYANFLTYIDRLRMQFKAFNQFNLQISRVLCIEKNYSQFLTKPPIFTH